MTETGPETPQVDPVLLAAATEEMRTSASPGVAPPDQEQVAAHAAASGLGATSVDIGELEKLIEARVRAAVDAAMASAARAQHAPVVQSTAETMRDLIATHAAHNPGRDHSEVLGLADDAVEAAKNAVSSGNGSYVTKIAAKLEKALHRVHPGPGDHHYFGQALDFAAVHLPGAADQLEPPAPQSAGAVGSSQPPAKVIEGNVTG